MLNKKFYINGLSSALFLIYPSYAIDQIKQELTDNKSTTPISSSMAGIEALGKDALNLVGQAGADIASKSTVGKEVVNALKDPVTQPLLQDIKNVLSPSIGPKSSTVNTNTIESDVLKLAEKEALRAGESIVNKNPTLSSVVTNIENNPAEQEALELVGKEVLQVGKNIAKSPVIKKVEHTIKDDFTHHSSKLSAVNPIKVEAALLNKQSISNGLYYIIPYTAKSKSGTHSIEAFPSSFLAKLTSTNTTNPDQKWMVQWYKKGYCYITCETQNQGIRGLEASPNSGIVRVNPTSNSNQRWSIVPTNNKGYYGIFYTDSKGSYGLKTSSKNLKLAGASLSDDKQLWMFQAIN